MFAFVKYVIDGRTAIVPSSFIKDFKCADYFSPNNIFHVFWSPLASETPEMHLEKQGRILIEPEKYQSIKKMTFAGYYAARIVLTADTEAELNEKLENENQQEINAISSSDDMQFVKNHAHKVVSIQKVMLDKSYETSEKIGNLKAQITLWKRRYFDVKDKLEKSEAKLEKIEGKLEKTEANLEKTETNLEKTDRNLDKLLNLNLKLQTEYFDLVNSHKMTSDSIHTIISNTSQLRSAASSNTIGTQTLRDIANISNNRENALDNESSVNIVPNINGIVHSIINNSSQSRKATSTNSISTQTQNDSLSNVSIINENTSDNAPFTSTAHDINDTLQVRSTSSVNLTLEQTTQRNPLHCNSTNKKDIMSSIRKSTHQIALRPRNAAQQNKEENMDLENTPNIEELMEKSMKNIKKGIYGDSLFAKNLALELYGMEELSKSSVRGVKCNSKKGSVPRPPLCTKKYDIIIDAFRKRAFDEGASEKEVEQRCKKIPKYVSEKNVTINRKLAFING